MVWQVTMFSHEMEAITYGYLLTHNSIAVSFLIPKPSKHLSEADGKSTTLDISAIRVGDFYPNWR